MTKVSVQPPPQAPAQRSLKVDTQDAPKGQPVVDSGESTRPEPSNGGAARLQQLQREAERAFAGTDVKLSISYDDASGLFVYRGVDPVSGEVVREYPAEEVLERMQHLRDMRGVSLDKIL